MVNETAPSRRGEEDEAMELDRHPLTYTRRSHHWSMADLARLLRARARQLGLRSGTDRNRIWRWESGTSVPSLESQELLADVLDVPRAAVGELGWPYWLPAFEQPAPFTPSGSRAALEEVQRHRMDRRSFLIISSTALVDMAADWARIEPAHLDRALDTHTIDPELLTWLEDRASELRAHATGPHHPQVSRLIDAHLATTIDFLSGAHSPATERRLYTVAAELALAAAWLRFDADRHADAQRHWQAAAHAAHQAGDRDLAAVAFADLGYQGLWLHRPTDAIHVLQHARTRTHSAAVRSLLDVRRARASAVLQDHRGTTTALASAETELDRICPDTTPAAVAWMSPADLTADAGRCWLDLGDPTRAETVISTGLAELDPRRTRTKAVFLTYRAEGALRTHDAPAAAAAARAALDAARATGASRCIDLVSTLMHRLHNHPEAPLAPVASYAHDTAPRHPLPAS
ncbi:Protein involved in sporulation [Streptomyces sp. YIM 130001]|uniref:helix-turn-helix domain-containing protein n=1 Tax=Streptomyces sp. YIM 130001 TaxID=2259644 RepID=UPI000E656CF8|nr:helix-turn-helix transcriptional regulator [Streptomyces sp. YIM 130001]RII07986.1 Protein involved in sporulation [Streptomyces sp. YIM 130001]